MVTTQEQETGKISVEGVELSHRSNKVLMVSSLCI